MVRILKVKDLQERRRKLIAQSEMHRQTLKLELANIKYSTALLKRRLKFLRTASRLAAVAVPLAVLFLFRRRANTKAGKAPAQIALIPKLITGLKLFGQLRLFLQRFRGTKPYGATERSLTPFS